MRAVTIRAPGGPEMLQLAERERPVAGAGEVLLKVLAAGVNRPDLLQRQGLYPPPPGASDVPGLEVAGQVVARAADVEWPDVGAFVCALLSGGGYAEYASVPAVQCLPWPRGLDALAAAALPETFFTVWHNVFERGRLQAGESLLVQGGASGIGVAALQLARAFGARVFATAGSTEKCAACVALGAERAFDYKREDFVAGVLEATDGRGVDVVLDMVAGDYTPRHLRLLAPEGRLVQIAFMRGAETRIDWRLIMQKRLTLTGSTLRAQPSTEKGRLARALREQVWPLLEAGRVRSVVHASFPLAQAAQAHHVLEAGTHVGKLVLSVASVTPPS
jgi:NADPH2:quinone reductase